MYISIYLDIYHLNDRCVYILHIGDYMEFTAMDRETLKTFTSDKTYVIIGAMDRNSFKLELEKDTNRKSIFMVKIEDGTISTSDIKNMFDYVRTYLSLHSNHSIDMILCYSDNTSIAMAIKNVLCDMFKVKRELHYYDELYQHVYSKLYKVAARLGYVLAM